MFDMCVCVCVVVYLTFCVLNSLNALFCIYV